MSVKLKIAIRFVAGFFAVTLMLFLLIRLNIFSGWFKVKKIEVLDNTYLPDSAIIRMGKIRKGADIFALNLENGTRDLLKNPYVRGAVISRELPYKVIIRVEERHPIAAFREGKKWMLVSEDGIVLPLLDEIVLGKIPVLSGMGKTEKLEPGKRLQNKKMSGNFAVVSEIYRTHPVIYALAAEIDASGKEDVIIKLMKDYGKIILDRKDYAANLLKLKLFFEQMDRLSVLEGNEYINLKFSDRIIVMDHQ